MEEKALKFNWSMLVKVLTLIIASIQGMLTPASTADKALVRDNLTAARKALAEFKSAMFGQ